MKKIIPIIALLSLIIVNGSYSASTYADEEYYFAKVEQSGIFMFSSPSDNSQIFEIPTSYFVKLTGSANEEFYAASYQDVNGYIKKEEVSPMQGQPASPYAEASLRVFSLEGLGLYKTPSLQPSDLIINVPYLTSDITYYGKLEGNAVPNKSNTWYYCKYTSATGTESGYLYSVFCDELTQIPVNNEYLPLITTPLFQPKSDAKAKGLSDVAKTFIILGVSLPCALIIYLLIKPTLSSNHAASKAPKRKRRRRGDYFEFDENDLA